MCYLKLTPCFLANDLKHTGELVNSLCGLRKTVTGKKVNSVVEEGNYNLGKDSNHHTQRWGNTGLGHQEKAKFKMAWPETGKIANLEKTWVLVPVLTWKLVHNSSHKIWCPWPLPSTRPHMQYTGLHVDQKKSCVTTITKSGCVTKQLRQLESIQLNCRSFLRSKERVSRP